LDDFIKNPQTRNALTLLPLNILAVGNVEKDVSVLIYLGRASISHSKCNLFPSCLEDGFLKNEGSIPPGTLEI
jgi:hypothetical protein